MAHSSSRLLHHGCSAAAAALMLLCSRTTSTTTFAFSPTLKTAFSQQRLWQVQSTPRQTASSLSSSVKAEDSTTTVGRPGTADMNWEELGFEFRPTNSHLKMIYRDGEGWGEPELVETPYINIHIGATALHYGQSCFEGLKAFAHENGDVCIFRPDENAKRIRASSSRIMMPAISTETFVGACEKVVRDNVAYVPPYGSNGSLYLRPLLFGSGPRIGLQPADEYTFIIMVMPVGDYYKGGLNKSVKCTVVEEYDRAAPKGVGAAKVAGNYAADLLPNMESKNKGFPISLYLDAKTNSCIEEFSTSNFIGIDRANKKYVTPESPSVLPSITNKSLMTMAEKDMGYSIERRDISVEELSNFDEVVACGTAVVVTPIGSIQYKEKTFEFGENEAIGDVTMELYNRVRDVQFGDAEDKYNWNHKVS